MTDGTENDQLTLAGTPRPKRPKKPAVQKVAESAPIARVLVDIGLAHLDRPFDYQVPAAMDADAVPGVRVRVRFAGADHDGYLLERADSTEHTGRLSPLRRVVSAEPVLTAEIATLARTVADRYAGTVADVLRLAIPPRHAATERASRRESEAGAAGAEGSATEPAGTTPTPPLPDLGGWAGYRHGAALHRALGMRRSGDAGDEAHPGARAVWSAGPGAAWPDLMARLVLTTVAAGRGVIAVAPDARDVARLDRALRELAGDGHHVVLEADAGPAERYRRWLAVRRGSIRAAIGTRSAAFAPVADLGLVAIWDDGDDLYAEPRAPYPHTREVLLLRAHLTGASVVIGGWGRSVESQVLVESGWATPVEPERAAVRAAAPQVHTVGDEREQGRDEAARQARLPSLAWRTARAGLGHGPVLVQVARAGYVPSLACARCRMPARCVQCGGGLRLGDASDPPRCERCATPAPSWRCAECGHDRLRAAVIGLRRTAEEMGRAFPGVPVLQSGAEAVVDRVDGTPRLVVATHGAEPEADSGYAAALLLDGTSLLNRPGLRAAEEALRRWLRAAALVRTRSEGGEIVVVADPAAAAVQALVRWDPGTLAERELVDRAALHLPPAARVAELQGAQNDVDDLLVHARLPQIAEISGPEETGDSVRTVIRVPRAQGAELARELRAAAGVRSAKRSGEPVRIRIDPADF